MMSRATVILRNDSDRDRAAAWCRKFPPGTRVEFKLVKRTLPQNDRMWAMLTDVATQLKWHGVKLTPDDWKLIFMDALNREMRAVPNLDGTGFVNLGRSSSDLSKDEMSDLIELIFEFGARHEITFHEPSAGHSKMSPKSADAGGKHSPNDAARPEGADHPSSGHQSGGF